MKSESKALIKLIKDYIVSIKSGNTIRTAELTIEIMGHNAIKTGVFKFAMFELGAGKMTKLNKINKSKAFMWIVEKLQGVSQLLLQAPKQTKKAKETEESIEDCKKRLHMAYFGAKSLQEIKGIYKRLTKVLHPDVNGGDDKDFRRLQKIYDSVMKIVKLEGGEEAFDMAMQAGEFDI